MSLVEVSSSRGPAAIAPLSADMVISFDNVAQWERQLGALGELQAVHRALRKGGILGIVERRAAEGASFRRMMLERAVTEDHVTALAEVAGFVLVSRTVVNGQAGTRMVLKFVKR